jgi:hypothetical protein
MLVIFMAAAVVISFFTHWDEVADGFRSGWNDAADTRR